MPYINVTTSQKLSAEQKKLITREFGAIISILPNKTEKSLMLDFSDGHSMFMNNQEMTNCAYVDIRMYGSAAYAHKSELTEKTFALLYRNLGIQEHEAYVSFSEYSMWGVGGKLK